MIVNGVIRKWWKFVEQAAFHVFFNRLHPQCSVWDSRLPLASLCSKLPCTLAFFCCSGPSAPTHNWALSTILSILTSLTWEMIPGPLPLYWKRWKDGWGLGMRLVSQHDSGDHKTRNLINSSYSHKQFVIRLCQSRKCVDTGSQKLLVSHKKILWLE